MNLSTKQNRATNVENKLMATRGKVRGGINLKIGIDTYTLLYIEQITKKDLLYSTRNSVLCNGLYEKGILKKSRYMQMFV